jgi:Bacteriophage related domain of unknown function
MSIDALSDPVWHAIRDRIETQWSYTQVQWPNEIWTQAPEKPWVKVDYSGNMYGQVSIGAETQATNRWDRDGELYFWLHVPKGMDINAPLGAALELARIFRGWTALNGDLEFMDASVARAAYNTDVGGWFVLPVTIEWRAVNQ